jgi:hypothetical protein
VRSKVSSRHHPGATGGSAHRGEVHVVQRGADSQKHPSGVHSKYFITGIRNASVCFGFGLLEVGMVACGTSSAHSAIAANHASAIRNATEQPKPPEAPQDGMALAIGPGVMVVWSPPPSNGGPAITKYEVIPSSGPPLTVAGPLITATLTGLQHGVMYTLTVRASNASGVRPLSLPSSVVNL